MRYKPLLIYLFISSIFHTLLCSIWKIMATLQGLKLTEINFNINFLLVLLLSFALIFIGNKINRLIKVLFFSSVFTVVYILINENAPVWYNSGVFLLSLFFTSRVKNYDLSYLKEDFISEKIIFDFLSLFAIVFFAFVILFPFYLMFVTSFKTQAALLYNPLDLSIDFTNNLMEVFKSYFIIFKTYDFGRYIYISSIVSIGTVIITLIFAIPAAYAVARLNFFGKTFLSTSILVIYMFPAIVLVIPLYTVFSQLGLRNSIEGLLIVLL